MKGIFPAVLTPFSCQGALDLDRFARHADRLYAEGVDGIFVGGNAGEWYALTLDERQALACAAVEVSRGRGQTIVHVGCLRMLDAVRLARHAAHVGADAISSLTPVLPRFDAGEIRGYFETLASATDLPFFVYYFPALTGGLCGELLFSCLQGIPNLAGYKFTDTNLFDLQIILEEGLTVLNGHDPNLKSALLMGAAGGVGAYYNILAGHSVSIRRACLAGDIGLADELQRQMNRVIRSVRQYRLIPALKFIAGLQDSGMGAMREPMLPLSQNEQSRLAKELEWLLNPR